MTSPRRRKLIEVSLPLDAINGAAMREKDNPFLRGHPRGLHQWWARRPLPACRAVLFASIVDDPSADPDRFPTLKAQEDERGRLFGIIERLAQWENSTNAEVLEEARSEIRRATNGMPPVVLDPFCGGGSIPVEAQRLGLTAYASDLNPVAVLITKALIEIPSTFIGQAPVHPDGRAGIGSSGTWQGAAGLAADIRRYGMWLREEAEARIGHLYPRVQLPRELGGGLATPTAWLWARTVACPNPACGASMPLVRSFVISSKKGRRTWIEPIINKLTRSVAFEVRTGDGTAPEPPKVGRGANFRCLVCGEISPDEHIKSEGRAGRMGTKLMAIVADGPKSRTYLSPDTEQEEVAASATPTWGPDAELADDPRALWTVNYGLTRFADLFTRRQLVALTTYTDLVAEARVRVRDDAILAGLANDGVPIAEGGVGATAYGDAVATYLALAIDKACDYNNALCTWNATNENIAHLFTKQAIPMAWDFVEASPLASGVAPDRMANSIAEVVANLVVDVGGRATQDDASNPGHRRPASALVSTDPPYYDNIGYADVSDFFYVWLRRSLASTYPSLFATVVTPKASELVAAAQRFGGNRQAAQTHFEDGLRRAFSSLHDAAHPDYPVTIYYAFKQSENAGEDDLVASTGWESMLTALLDAGFTIDGTWPLRTERITRSVSIGTNALASSVVFVCRRRDKSAGITDRRGFLAAMKAELPEALRTLQHGNIAPVDLAEASIGPGMAVYSRYGKVVEPDGRAMTVRTALGLINQVLSEVLSEQEDEFDSETRWAVAWFSEHLFEDGPFGDAHTYFLRYNTAANALQQAGIIETGRGKVRLLGRAELDALWDPATDKRLTIWEVTQHLIHTLELGGEAPAAQLVRRVGGLADTARDLAYRLFAICERKKWADEALAYNMLVTAWPEITRLAASTPSAEAPQQTQLFS